MFRRSSTRRLLKLFLFESGEHPKVFSSRKFKKIYGYLSFSKEVDKRKVMAGKLWSYDRTILIINEFDGQISPSQMNFTISPIWCGRIIHGSEGCDESNLRKTSHDGGSEGWGHWLRADDLTKRPMIHDSMKMPRSPVAQEKPYQIPVLERRGEGTGMEIPRSAAGHETNPPYHSPSRS